MLNPSELKKIDAYWRASNYLAAGQLYLLDNPMLRRPLTRDDVKKKIVGHWGTVPGQNFVYVHLNRVIKKYDQDMILISGPGHGGNFFVANAYLDGTYSEVYPNISRDEEGMKKLCKQFSFPGGISSHVAPETPGAIIEGGELGFSRALARGGTADGVRLIGSRTLKLMSAPHLNARQLPGYNQGAPCAFGPSYNYGFGVRVMTEPIHGSSISSVGEWGWSGALGTWMAVDPKEDLYFAYMHQHAPADHDAYKPKLLAAN